MEEETKNMLYRRFSFWAVVIICILLLFLYESASKNKNLRADYKEMQDALKDTLKTWVDKDGNNRARISVIQAENYKLFTQAATKDSTISKLQKLVKENSKYIKNGGSVAIVNTQGNINTTVPTKPIDVTKNDPQGFPTYESDFNLKGWVWGNTVAKKDSTSIDLKYRDEFDIVIGSEGSGFLKLGKRKSFVEITSKNPYSNVKDLRVYQNKPLENKKWHIGPAVIYGVDSDLKTNFFVGAGVMWTPINF